MINVPCNGCTLCCRNDCVRLLPGDDVSRYRTVPHKYYAGELMLAHSASGNCVYLSETGCTIQDDKPRMCREMDCRNIALTLTRTQIRKFPWLKPVWTKGRYC